MGKRLINIRYYTFIYKSDILLRIKKMPSKNGVMVYLKKDDKPLFEKAVKKYRMNQSELLKEIIHAWLFSNKLKLEEKNDKVNK